MTTTFRNVTLSVSPELRAVWNAAVALEPGGSVRIELGSKEDALRVQRWFFRERKRQKRDLLNTTPGLDPDAADLVAGCYTHVTNAGDFEVRRPRSVRVVLRAPDGEELELMAREGAKRGGADR